MHHDFLLRLFYYVLLVSASYFCFISYTIAASSTSFITTSTPITHSSCTSYNDVSPISDVLLLVFSKSLLRHVAGFISCRMKLFQENTEQITVAALSKA
jgi:hypothetical protein